MTWLLIGACIVVWLIVLCMVCCGSLDDRDRPKPPVDRPDDAGGAP